MSAAHDLIGNIKYVKRKEMLLNEIDPGFLIEKCSVFPYLPAVPFSGSSSDLTVTIIKLA